MIDQPRASTLAKNHSKPKSKRNDRQMEITILGEKVSSLERAQEILLEVRAKGSSEGIARCLYAITQIAPGTPAALAAAAEIEDRWEISKAEAKARTLSMERSKPANDPFEPQRHRRGRKSHLAAAINQNIHDNPGMGCVWFVIFFIAITGSVIMMLLGK